VHFVPNAAVVQYVMSNFSLSQGFTRVEIPFTMNSNARMGPALEILCEAVMRLLSGDPDIDAKKPVQIICREMDGEGSEMAVQVFYRSDRSVDRLRTRVLDTITSELIRLDALPSQRIAIDRAAEPASLRLSEA
jgi:hypothetical protein